jgi:hypothetical protein
MPYTGEPPWPTEVTSGNHVPYTDAHEARDEARWTAEDAARRGVDIGDPYAGERRSAYEQWADRTEPEFPDPGPAAESGGIWDEPGQGVPETRAVPTELLEAQEKRPVTLDAVAADAARLAGAGQSRPAAAAPAPAAQAVASAAPRVVPSPGREQDGRGR